MSVVWLTASPQVLVLRWTKLAGAALSTQPWLVQALSEAHPEASLPLLDLALALVQEQEQQQK